MKEKELWKKIKNENYEVSNYGNVRHIKNRNNLTQFFGTDGYLRITMSRGSGNNPSIGIIHRLVAKNFITKPKGKSQVNHKNGVKSNNKVTNLEWVTPKENTRHAIGMGLINTKKILKKQPKHH